MKLNGIILSFAVLPVAFIAGRRSGGSSSGGSQPRPSPTSNNTPNRTPSSSNNGPSSNFASGFRPTSSQVGRTNPSPDFKPVNPSGAPTSASGGGGYYSSQSGSSSRAGLGGTGSLIAAGAGGFLIGSFLYGGMFRSPSCGGGYSYGSSNGCNYGTSTQGHQCTAQIPMCPIPETVRTEWYKEARTELKIQAQTSTCSISKDFSAELSGTETITENNVTTTVSAKNITLVDCMNAVVLDGTCTVARFIYDNVNNICGCCTQGEPFKGDDFSSAIYGYSTSNDIATYGAPTHCISGSTMFWPKISTDVALASSDPTLPGGGGFTDVSYKCQCGICASCGAPAVEYMDWAGPFTVSTVLGEKDSAESTPKYDPVDTCKCNDNSANCPSVNSAAVSSARSCFLAAASALLMTAATAA